jgi:hypothetical protein
MAARWISRTSLALGALGALAAGPSAARAGQLALAASPTTLTGGSSFQLSVTLTNTPGQTLSAVALDISYPAASVAAGACQLGPAGTQAGKQILQRRVRPGLLRVGVWGVNNSAIPNGVVFTCAMRAVTFAPPGPAQIAGASEAATARGGSAALSAGFSQVSVRADGDGDGISVSGTLARCTGGQNVGCSDNCPSVSNPNQADRDGDGVGDACDICPDDPNPPGEGGAIGEQLDSDGNGIGNRCDCDFNGDGFCDASDFEVFLEDFASRRDSGFGTDMNGDGVVDVQDYRLLVRALSRTQ